MTYTLVRYDLADFEEWKAVFDERAPARAEHGWLGGQIFTRRGSEEKVVLLAEWESSEQAEAYFDSSEFRQDMKRAGVQRKPDVTVLEHVEDVPLVEDESLDADGSTGESADDNESSGEESADDANR